MNDDLFTREIHGIAENLGNVMDIVVIAAKGYVFIIAFTQQSGVSTKTDVDYR